jgi:hypothetical protein
MKDDFASYWSDKLVRQSDQPVPELSIYKLAHDYAMGALRNRAGWRYRLARGVTRETVADAFAMARVMSGKGMIFDVWVKSTSFLR